MSKFDIVDEILGTDFTEKIGEDWTFAGVLIEYWEDVSRSWKASVTQTTYLKDYKKYVLPYLDDLPLKDCARENFDRCLELLPETKKKEGLTYNLGVERHIKWIIKKVLEAAEKNDVCPDILWGTDYSFPAEVTEETLNANELVKLRKSFQISEEANISCLILEDPQQSGENFGLALMFGLGLRNNEACGTKFGDIQPFLCDKNRYYMRIYSSTALGTNAERYGGKTSNMARFIPIPRKLLTLLFRRRELLYHLISDGKLKIDDESGQNKLDDLQINTFIDRLPIACRGEDFINPCSAKVLTQAAKKLLKTINLEQDILSLIDREFRRAGRTEDGIKEKEPTAYLFRRNLGTHLYLLGLNDSEIQYIMGHDIEDDNEERHFFRNEEKLYPIALKMEKRPIVNDINDREKKDMSGYWLAERNAYQEEIHIPVSEKLKKVIVTVEQREPLSNLQLRVSGPVKGKCEQFACETPLDETMSITKVYHDQYGKKTARLDSIRRKKCEEQESLS